MKQGDRIKLQLADKPDWLPGTVLLISENERSLALQMDDYYSSRAGSGLVVSDGIMLVYNGKEFMDVFTGALVKVEPL